MESFLITREALKMKNGFESVYNHYFDSAMRIAKAILKDESLAADAVQETFLRVYRNSDTYDEERSFSAWFNTILINECKRVLEKRKRITYLTEYEEKDGIRWNEEWEVKYTLETLLEELEDKIKIPIMLKYLQGLKIEEIAQSMDLNPNTVKSRLAFGRNKLREFYTKFYKEVQ